MDDHKTLLDEKISWFKNHPVIVAILIIAIFIVGLGTFTDSLTKIISFVERGINFISAPSGPVFEEQKISSQQTQQICRQQVAAHLERMHLKLPSEDALINIAILEDLDNMRESWRYMLEIDAISRKRQDPLCSLPYYSKSDDKLEEIWFRYEDGEPYSAPPSPTGIVADWIRAIQDTEFDLALKAARNNSFRAYNKISRDIVNEFWASPNPNFKDFDYVSAAPLYFLTRMVTLKNRFELFYINEQNPFSVFSEFIKSNVLPVGLQRDGTFLYAKPTGAIKEENLARLCEPPIMTGLDLSDLMQNPPKIMVYPLSTELSKENIGNRIQTLDLQLAAVRYALYLHLGGWYTQKASLDRTNTIIRYKNIFFNLKDLSFLLEAGAKALWQLREIYNSKSPYVHNIVPSLGISHARFDSNDSIWFHINEVHVTQLTSVTGKNKCFDPILDINVINYSSTPCIIHSVLFRHYGTWVEPKAVLPYGLLKSLETINIQVDFEKNATMYAIDPPIFIEPNSPARFKLRLVDFAKKCPGSDSFIQVGFVYNGQMICDSPIFHMDILGSRPKTDEHNSQQSFSPETSYSLEREEIPLNE